VVASGKPFNPSTTATSTSSTPRFFSSFIPGHAERRQARGDRRLHPAQGAACIGSLSFGGLLRGYSNSAPGWRHTVRH
jgi:hypothetical protein